MPTQPQWLLQLPAIIETLQALPAPVVDRSLCEQLFGLRRRQAIALLHRFGGYQAGRTLLADRLSLLNRLEEIRRSGLYQRESRRHSRLDADLASARRNLASRSVRILVAVEPAMELPDGIALEPRRLTITFDSGVELLEKLFALSQAISRDYTAFQRVIQME